MALTSNSGGNPQGGGPPSPPPQNHHTEQASYLLGVQHPEVSVHPPEESRRPSLKTNNITDLHSLWIWEILSFAAAGVLYGIFFWLLFRYDNQRVSRWEKDSPISDLFRTLQSAISFITTIMKAAILLPVASAIGQLKWHYAQRASRVKDIELIDSASRGNLGAVRLLFSRSGMHLTSLGCVIAISAVLLGPFIQNTVQIQTRIYFDEASPNTLTPLLPVTNRIGSISMGPNPPSANGTGIGVTMFSSIQAGWAAGAKSRDIRSTELPWECQFDFCEWTNFTTLSVQYDCREADVEQRRHPVTDVIYAGSIQADIDNLIKSVPSSDGKVFTNEYLTRLNLYAQDAIPKRSIYTNLSNNIALLVHFAALGYLNETYQAAECVLYWTPLQYKSLSLNASIAHWTAKHTEYQYTSSNVSRDTQEPIIFDELKTCTFNDTVQPCNFTVEPYYYRGIRELLIPFLSDFSNYYYHNLSNNPADNNALDFAKPRIEMFYADWRDRVRNGYFPLQGSLKNQSEWFMEQMALYITNNIRSNSGTFVFGKGASFDAYFAINKRYAAYPSVIFAASILFVSVTAWMTRRERIWKNSALALLFHGLDHAPREEEEDISTLEGMERVSERMVVRLSDDGDGLGLKLRTE